MIRLTPWFLGKGGLGLSKDEARSLFGPPVPMIVRPGDPPLNKQKGAELRTALMSVSSEIKRAFELEGLPSTGTFYGVRGVGLVYPHPAQRGKQHIIPVALMSPDAVKFLTEPESRALVNEPAPTRPQIALEVIRTELPGDAARVQAEDVEPSTAQTLFRYALPVGLVAGVGGAAFALTR